ncbi:Elicitin-like protein [Globisporangium polare]
MKFSLVAIAATLAVVSAVDCDLNKISPLLTDPNVATCTTDSGYSFTALAAPTAETLPKLCASDACKKVLTAVTALGLGDCTLLGLKLETDLVNPITKACSGSSSSTASAGSSAGSKASSATVTTPAPASTTATPKTATSGSSASSSTVKTPSTTTTPTPTPTATKSAASAVTVAASAAVVAVAAAFM